MGSTSSAEAVDARDLCPEAASSPSAPGTTPATLATTRVERERLFTRLALSRFSRAALSCFLLLAAASGAIAQEVIVREPRVDQSRFVVIDDMVIEVERLAEVSRPQGALLDFRAVNGYWDFGVIPYQMSPEFTDAQRQNIEAAMAGWMSVAPIMFVPRSTQSGYALFTKLDSQGTMPSPCFSNVGQFRRGVSVQINLGSICANSQSTAFHEIGHLLGLFHEQSRSGIVTSSSTSTCRTFRRTRSMPSAR